MLPAENVTWAEQELYRIWDKVMQLRLRELALEKGVVDGKRVLLLRLEPGINFLTTSDIERLRLKMITSGLSAPEIEIIISCIETKHRAERILSRRDFRKQHLDLLMLE